MGRNNATMMSISRCKFEVARMSSVVNVLALMIISCITLNFSPTFTVSGLDQAEGSEF